MAGVWRGGRADGKCVRCSEAKFDKANRCRVCATVSRKARLLGISWDEAFLLPRNFKDEREEVPPEELSAKQRYLKTEKGKAYSRRWAAYRRANISTASLLVGDEWNNFVIEELYLLATRRERETGIGWHIDHIVPLNGKFVSGMHVWYNLQLIPAKLNILKNNKVV